MKWLIVLLCLLITSPVQAVISGHIGGAVGDGLIGNTSEVSTTGPVPVSTAYFNVLTTTTPGNVRYAHVKIHDSDGTETVCLSLQADGDGGTVHLSGSGTAPASGWLNIDCSSSFELQTATDYRLVLQTDNAVDVKASAYTTGDLRRDSSFSYDCGGAVTDDAQQTEKTMTIIFNNSAGDPT